MGQVRGLLTLPQDVSPSGPGHSGSPQASPLVVVVALRAEAGLLLPLLPRPCREPGLSLWRSALRGMPLWLIRCGPGPARAEAAARSLLARTRPRALLSCGFCGGLDPEAPVAEVVAGLEAVSPEGEVVRADPGLAALALEMGATPGRILTVDRILRLAADKQAAFRAHGARVVDMETLALARTAARQHIPWLAVRAVGDDAGSDLPLDFEACQDAQGEVRALPLALAFLRRPGQLPRLWHLACDTRRAGAALARFLAGFLDRLALWPL